jgi:hypothetical protein
MINLIKQRQKSLIDFLSFFDRLLFLQREVACIGALKLLTTGFL